MTNFKLRAVSGMGNELLQNFFFSITFESILNTFLPLPDYTLLFVSTLKYILCMLSRDIKENII